jgi:hypothetical protein
MTAVPHNLPATFAGRPLGDSRHVCAFFSSANDEYQTMLPVMREGLDAGERLVNFMPNDRTDHEDRLRAGGIDVDGATEAHQLDIIKSEDAYLTRNGRFDGQAMLQRVPELLRSGRDFGYELTRLIAHAEHMAKDPDDADAFIQYESALNYILPQYPDVVICTYDLTRVTAGMVMDVLRTHPMVVIEGLLQENPFFIPPDQFLQQMGERRKTTDRRRKSTTRKSGNGKRH